MQVNDSVKVKRQWLKAVGGTFKQGKELFGAGRIIKIEGSIATVVFNNGHIQKFLDKNLIPFGQPEIE